MFDGVTCGISRFKREKLAADPTLDEVSLTRLYLGDDDCAKNELYARARCLLYMVENWDRKMHNLFNNT